MLKFLFFHKNHPCVSFWVLLFLETSSGTHLELIGTIKPQKSTTRPPIPLTSPHATQFEVLGGLCGKLRDFLGGILEQKYLHLGGHSGQMTLTIFKVLHLDNATTEWEGLTPRPARDIHPTKTKKNQKKIRGDVKTYETVPREDL